MPASVIQYDTNPTPFGNTTALNLSNSPCLHSDNSVYNDHISNYNRSHAGCIIRAHFFSFESHPAGLDFPVVDGRYLQ